MVLTPFSEFVPTAFDSHITVEGREEWWVVPATRNRDSAAAENSNFEAALALLGGESDTVETHSFGHWACGWFEIILVAPSREADVAAIEAKLEDHPLLDEDAYDQLASDDAQETWDMMSTKTRMQVLQRLGICYLRARHDTYTEADNDNGRLFDYLRTP